MNGNGIDFNAVIEDVALRLVGRSNLNNKLSNKYELRFGTHGSLSVQIAGEKAGTWYDHEAKTGGGVLEFVCVYNHCASLAEAAEWVKSEILHSNGTRRIVATYDYRDENSKLTFQVVRYEPKGFSQRRPDPASSDGWSWKVAGFVKPVPYRLPELLAEPNNATVFVTEGEKDADNLTRHGLLATCNAGGAKNWKRQLDNWFKDRDVVIVPDNDEAGGNHAALVAYYLNGIAARIRILALPDLSEKQDVSDWLEAGRTIDELLTLVEDTPDWTPHADPQEPEQPEETEPQPEPTDELPVIEVVAGKRPQAADAGMEALIAAGVPVYRRGPKIVYVARFSAKTSDGSDIQIPSIMPVPPPLLSRYLGQVAIWKKYDGRAKKVERIDPPDGVVTQLNSMTNEWRFPSLAGVINTPTLRPDGSILDQPGYDPKTGLILFDPPEMPRIPVHPSKDDTVAALRLLNELLDEFPFAGKDEAAKEASRAVALSMQMTPGLRGALNPAVPLHAAKSPHPGSGKSYLADCASAIATGEPCPVIGRSPREEEMEKRLHTAAMKGQPIISLDNVNGVLSGDFLCQLVERPLVQIRILGVSDDVKITNSFTVFCNGNNIEIAADLVRRTIQCMLDASLEHPEMRQFKRNPVKMILADRGLYIAAVLTIARAYICAGMPEKPVAFMSFDAWSDIVSGSPIWLGCADPVDTVDDLANADPTHETRLMVFQAIATLRPAKFYPNGYSTAELVAEAERLVDDRLVNPELREALLSVARDEKQDSNAINRDRLGWWLKQRVTKSPTITSSLGIMIRRGSGGLSPG